jgi:hypothetical protein
MTFSKILTSALAVSVLSLFVACSPPPVECNPKVTPTTCAAGLKCVEDISKMSSLGGYCEDDGNQSIVPPTDVCSLVSCNAGEICRPTDGKGKCFPNGAGDPCATKNCTTGQHCEVQGMNPICVQNNDGGTGATVAATLQWTIPSGLNVTRVVFRGSILGFNGSQWHDMCTLGLNPTDPKDKEKVITVSGNTYSCTRNFPADMTRKLTVQGYLEVGDTSVPLPSHTNQQFGCFRLWGTEAMMAGCTGTGCFRSYGELKVNGTVWSVATGKAIGNGEGPDRIDGCNYYDSY